MENIHSTSEACITDMLTSTHVTQCVTVLLINIQVSPQNVELLFFLLPGQVSMLQRATLIFCSFITFPLQFPSLCLWSQLTVYKYSTILIICYVSYDFCEPVF